MTRLLMLGLLVLGCTLVSEVDRGRIPGECGWYPIANGPFRAEADSCMMVQATNEDSLVAMPEDEPCATQGHNCMVSSDELRGYGHSIAPAPDFDIADATLNADGSCPLVCP